MHTQFLYDLCLKIPSSSSLSIARVPDVDEAGGGKGPALHRGLWNRRGEVERGQTAFLLLAAVQHHRH
jgi:hypothetical protein